MTDDEAAQRLRSVLENNAPLGWEVHVRVMAGRPPQLRGAYLKGREVIQGRISTEAVTENRPSVMEFVRALIKHT